MSSDGLMNPTTMPTRQGQLAQYGDDRNLLVRFEKRAILMEYESEKTGKPVYQDRDYVIIMQPGGKSDLIREVIKHQREDIPPDTVRWERQWTAYINQEKQVHDGIPLENWPAIGHAPAAVKGFKAGEVHTVEQLAGLPDSHLSTIPVMDGRKWRDLAKRFVEQAAGAAPITALHRENEDLKAEMKIMREQIEALAANQRKTPGRKPAQHDEGDDE